jgi:single-strand DNA-binding protein
MLNSVSIMGRLTRDSELQFTNNGTAVSKFSVAVNHWKDDVSYFDVVIYGKLAEGINKYLTKGRQLGVSGELRQQRWEKEGRTQSRIEIVASNVELVWEAKADSVQDVAGPEAFTDDIPF